MKGIFVIGTDTGVGKTIIASGIASALKKRGIDVGVMKPLESGCDVVEGRMVPNDALLLKDASGVEDSIEEINPYSLKEPLAPSVAADIVGTSIDIEKIMSNFKYLKEKHKFLIVEGAGGLLVPVKGKFLFSDLIKKMGLPALIVARANLGTINHTLLTVNHAKNLQINVLGIIINHLSDNEGLAEKTNPDVLKELLDVPILGNFPYSPLCAENIALLADLAEKNIDIPFFMKNFQAG
jgi:dethiobiotin synthetase